MTSDKGLTQALLVNESARIAPYLLSAGFLVLGACIYNDWRARRELNFKLITYVHGPEFIKLRHAMVKLMDSAKGDNDIEPMIGWFPTGTSFKNESNESSDAFEQGHVIANMAYFIYHVRTYHNARLLDRQTTVNLFHDFFAHYEIVMLEFAAALKACRRDLKEKGFPFDERWDEIANGIEDFFVIIGLSGRLPKEHRYYFFASLNKRE